MLRAAVRIAAATLLGLVLVVLALRVAITQPALGGRPFPDDARADETALRAHVEFLADPRYPRNYRHPESLDRAAAYIHEAFARSGARVREQDYEVRESRFRNVVALLGPDEGPRVVVGSHYDVFGDLPGADDNASGVAGLLETARLLGRLTLRGPVELVAYSTEEMPSFGFFGSSGMGSSVHARSLSARGVELEGMICLEMIGYFSRSQSAPGVLTRLLYPSTGDFILVAGRWRDRPLIRRVKKGFRGASAVPAWSYCGPTGVGSDQSDHRSYWEQGYSAVMITDTAFLRNPHYHTAGDLPDTLDYRRMAEVVRGVVAAVVGLQTDAGQERATSRASRCRGGSLPGPCPRGPAFAGSG